MKKAIIVLACIMASLLIPLAGLSSQGGGRWVSVEMPSSVSPPELPLLSDGGFDVEILVEGRPLEEYLARGNTYVEAREGAEYEVRVRNPLGVRVAVALSVDGLNTIDARRSAAKDASKWVIEPYQTITIGGWQMSSERARKFYFTTEGNSYGAKLGQTSNLGLISAVFFRERQPVGVVVPPPYRREPMRDRDGVERSESKSRAPSTSARGDERAGAQSRSSEAYPVPDDDYAATGIGRNVRNDVRWINLDLESRPAAAVTIRYEYHDALVRLGIFPRPYPRPDTLRRRERATGYTDQRYSPEP